MLATLSDTADLEGGYARRGRHLLLYPLTDPTCVGPPAGSTARCGHAGRAGGSRQRAYNSGAMPKRLITQTGTPLEGGLQRDEQQFADQPVRGRAGGCQQAGAVD
jgi:hypothetical protein